LNYPGAGILTTEYVLDNNTVGAANFPAPPTRDGLAFMGWTRTQDGIAVPPMTNDVHATTGVGFTWASIVAPAQSPLTVYAQWGHQVTFDGNGVALSQAWTQGDARSYLPRTPRAGLSVAQTNAAYGWITLVWPNNPTRAGFAFDGWNTESDGSGQFIDGDTLINENMTVYAIWRPVQVIFEHNDSTGDYSVRNVWTNWTINFAADMPNPPRPGYVLMGWNREPNGSGANFTHTTVVPIVDSPLTVYAQWGNTLTFLNQGSQVAVVDVLHGRSAAETNLYPWTTADWPASPTRAGYTFMGWYTDPGTYLLPFDANAVVTAETELHARWVTEFPMEVNFRLNDSTAAIHASVTTQADGSVGAGNMPADPIRGGYHFMGWTRNPGGLGIATGTAEGVRFTEESTITGAESPFDVYAQWGHQISFNNGAGGALLQGTDPGNPAHFLPRLVQTNSSLNETSALIWTDDQVWPNDPTHTSQNHAFRGWWTQPNGAGTQVTADTPITKDMELFAHWVLREVIFHGNGGALTGTTTVPTHPDNYPVAVRRGTVSGNVNLTLDHYRFFMGWTRSPDPLYPGAVFIPGTPGPGAAEVPGTVVGMDEAPLHVYAQWGNLVTFRCLQSIPPLSPHSTMIISHGMSIAESDALTWTSHGLMPNLVRPGHVFSHWEAVVAGLGTVDEDFPITQNLILDAVWLPQDTLTVTFYMCQDSTLGTVPDGGRVHSNTRSVFYGESVAQSSISVNHTPATRQNIGIAWPGSAPLIHRSTPDGRPMFAESWWTEPGGQAGPGELWVRHGFRFGHSGTSTHNVYTVGTGLATRSVHHFPGESLHRPITEDTQVYPNWTFRVNFHPGVHSNSIRQNIPGTNIPFEGPGFWIPNTPSDLVPGDSCFYSNQFRLYRDIPAVGPNYEGGTINADGFVRNMAGEIVPMGMPHWDMVVPDRIDAAREGIFVGWWNYPIPWYVPLGQEAAYGFPNAVQYVGTEPIDRNRTLYARIIPEPPAPPVTVTFHPNGGEWWSRPVGSERAPDWEQVIHTDPIIRRAAYGHALAFGQDMPSMPIRDGYIFMGWFECPTGPPPNFPWNTTHHNQNNPNHDFNQLRFHAGTIVTEPIDVFAYWRPAHLLIFDPNEGLYQGFPHYAMDDLTGRGYRLVAEGLTMRQMQHLTRCARDNSLNARRSVNALPPPVLACGRVIPEGHPVHIPGQPAMLRYWYNTGGGGAWELEGRANHRTRSELAIPENDRRNFVLLGSTRAHDLQNQGGAAWNTAANSTGTPFNIDTIVTGPQTLYAQWQVILTFDVNFRPGQTMVERPVLNTLAGTHYTVGGTLGLMHRIVPYGFSMATRNDHPNVSGSTANPTWRPDHPTAASLGPVATTFPRPNPLSLLQFEQRMLQYEEFFDVTFVGWNTEPDGSGMWINEGTVMQRSTIEGHTRLYAQWSSYITFLPGIAGELAGIPVTGERRVADSDPMARMHTAPHPDDPTIMGFPQFSSPGWDGDWVPGVTFVGWRAYEHYITGNPDLPILLGHITGDSVVDGSDYTAYAHAGIRTLVAVWQLPVVFDPTGGRGIFDTPLSPHFTVGTPRQVREQYLPAHHMPLQGETLRGYTTEHEEWRFIDWNDHRWGKWQDTGVTFDTTTRIITSPPRTWWLYAQWEADVTFNLQGGRMTHQPPAIWANPYVVTIPEAPWHGVDAAGVPIIPVDAQGQPLREPITSRTHYTMLNSEHAGQPQLMPQDPHRPGYQFLGWSPYEVDTYEYVLGEFVLDNPFTGSCHILGHRQVFAQWRVLTTDFGFYKTSDHIYIYDDEPEIFTRNDAVFRLYRQVDENAPLFEDRWEFIAERTSATHPIHGHGWVDFDGEITYVGIYALVEAQAPHGYRTPTSYWTIHHKDSGTDRHGQAINPWDHETWELTIIPSYIDGVLTTLPGDAQNLPFRRLERVSGSGDYYWFVGNELIVRFALHKTNHLLYSQVSQDPNVPTNWEHINEHFLLAGAEFSLFRWDNRTTAPPDPPDAAGLVTDNTFGSGQWLPFADVDGETSSTSSGYVGAPIVFELDRRYRHYQLVETQPPPACPEHAPNGFEMPRGQWRLTLIESETRPGPDWYWAGNDWWLQISAVGDTSIPAFATQPRDNYALDANGDYIYENGVRVLVCGAGDWYVGNRPVLELPLMGGRGRSPFTLAGLSLLLLAMGAMTYQVRRNKLALADGECAGSCADCAHGTKLGATKVFCLRRGVMPIAGGCGRFTHHLRE
jgi:uncharacterized repeat protein (TIGR02543 family)